MSLTDLNNYYLWKNKMDLKNIRKEVREIKKINKKVQWTAIWDKVWIATAKTLADNWIVTDEQVAELWLMRCMQFIKSPLARKSFEKYYNTYILKLENELNDWNLQTSWQDEDWELAE